MKTLLFLLMAVCTGLYISETVPAHASDYYAMLQFTDPKSGLSQIVFQRCDSRPLCRTLNESHWKGAKASCPDCVKDIETCLNTVPDSYKGIYEDKPITFPYLSSKEDRIIYLGVPIKDAIKASERAAESYRTNLNRPATVIMPMDLFK